MPSPPGSTDRPQSDRLLIPTFAVGLPTGPRLRPALVAGRPGLPPGRGVQPGTLPGQPPAASGQSPLLRKSLDLLATVTFSGCSLSGHDQENVIIAGIFPVTSCHD